MSGKKTMGWKSILLGLAAAMTVDLLGVLLVTLLTVRGAVGEGSGFPLLAVAALCAAFTGGMIAGGGGVDAAGALLHTGLFGVLLVLICFGAWEGVTIHGLILLAMVLLGGLLSGAVRGKVGKRRRKGLVKSHKKRI